MQDSGGVGMQYYRKKDVFLSVILIATEEREKKNREREMGGTDWAYYMCE